MLNSVKYCLNIVKYCLFEEEHGILHRRGVNCLNKTTILVKKYSS